MSARLHRITKRILLITLFVMTLLGVAVVVLPRQKPWTKFASVDEEIDLRSGRIRYTSYKFFRQMSQEPDSRLSIVTRRPIEASDAEVARNPRARSAKLRVAERLA